MTIDKEHAREIAQAAGLTRLDDKHLNQLAASVTSGQELAAKLPKDLHWSEEMALVFRLPIPASKKP